MKERAPGDNERLGLRQVWSLPYADPAWPGKVVLGGVLLLLSPLVLPLVFVHGYLVAVARLPLSSPALPRWSPLLPRLADGARLSLLLLAYSWPALFSLSTVVVGPLVIGGPLTGSRWAGWLVGLALTLQPIGLAWLLVNFLLFPLLLRRAAATVSLARALSPLALLALARANLRRLPRLWLGQLLYGLVALPGLLLAIVGFTFTFFWALLATTRLSADLREPVG